MLLFGGGFDVFVGGGVVVVVAVIVVGNAVLVLPNIIFVCLGHECSIELHSHSKGFYFDRALQAERLRKHRLVHLPRWHYFLGQNYLELLCSKFSSRKKKK